MVSMKILSSKTVFKASDQHIRMISEGSCDTEDWSNDAEKSALHQRNKLHFQIYIYFIFTVFLTK